MKSVHLSRLEEVGLRRRTCGNADATHACRNPGHAAAAEYALGLDPSLGLCIALACTLPLYLAYYSTYLAYYFTNLDACVRRNLARLTLFCILLYSVSPPTRYCCLEEVGLRRRTCGNADATHACRNPGHAAAAEYALGLDPSLGLCIALACTLPLYLAYYSTYLAYYFTNLDACVRRNLARLTLFCILLYSVSPPTRYCCRSAT
jgi:hypothetical protein